MVVNTITKLHFCSEDMKTCPFVCFHQQRTVKEVIKDFTEYKWTLSLIKRMNEHRVELHFICGESNKGFVHTSVGRLDVAPLSLRQ